MSKNNTGRTNSRAVAAEVLRKWLSTGDFPDRLIEYVDADRAFVMEVVFGVARWKRAIEWVIGRCTKRAPDDNVTPYLFVGLYQILLMDSVAGYAAVNETVEAIKAGPASQAAGFLNAVLRRVLRESATIREEIKRQSPGIRESHPDILVDRWTRRFGENKMLELCRWNNRRAEVTIRPNMRKIFMEDFLAMLKSAGVKAFPHPFAPDECLVLPHGARVTDLPGWSDGLFSVQDPSTITAVNLLDPQPGEIVLDACAAPGGKTVLIGERMQDNGHIVAVDLSKDRILMLRANLRRMGLCAVSVVEGDASIEESVRNAFDQTISDPVGSANQGRAQVKLFDRVLLDVPCTNTGVLRRRPDARWRFSLERMADLVDIQRALLENTVRLLKPGGVLVYSTCSLEPEECNEIVQSWVNATAAFEISASVELFPPETGTDGIYAAALRRTG